jgi:hypothetical protein
MKSSQKLCDLDDMPIILADYTATLSINYGCALIYLLHIWSSMLGAGRKADGLAL